MTPNACGKPWICLASDCWCECECEYYVYPRIVEYLYVANISEHSPPQPSLNNWWSSSSNAVVSFILTNPIFSSDYFGNKTFLQKRPKARRGNCLVLLRATYGPVFPLKWQIFFLASFHFLHAESDKLKIVYPIGVNIPKTLSGAHSSEKINCFQSGATCKVLTMTSWCVTRRDVFRDL